MRGLKLMKKRWLHESLVRWFLRASCGAWCWTWRWLRHRSRGCHRLANAGKCHGDAHQPVSREWLAGNVVAAKRDVAAQSVWLSRALLDVADFPREIDPVLLHVQGKGLLELFHAAKRVQSTRIHRDVDLIRAWHCSCHGNEPCQVLDHE